jgi:hypothetical protein
MMYYTSITVITIDYSTDTSCEEKEMVPTIGVLPDDILLGIYFCQAAPMDENEHWWMEPKSGASHMA